MPTIEPPPRGALAQAADLVKIRSGFSHFTEAQIKTADPVDA